MSAVPRRLWQRARHRVIDQVRFAMSPSTPWVPDGRPVFVLVHHRGGGGTDRHLRELAASLRTAGVRPVMVSPGPDHSLIWEEADTGGRESWTFRGGSTRESMTAMLETMKPVHAHIHSIMKLPELLVELLASRSDVRLDAARLLSDLPALT